MPRKSMQALHTPISISQAEKQPPQKGLVHYNQWVNDYRVSAVADYWKRLKKVDYSKE